MDVVVHPLRNCLNTTELGEKQESSLKVIDNKPDRHLNLRSRKSNITAEKEKESGAVMEDFELAIKENYLEKDNSKEEAVQKDNETEHDSVMTTSEDEVEGSNSIETHSEDDACIITHSEEDEPMKEIKQESISPFEELTNSEKIDADECSTAAATRASSECSMEVVEIKEEKNVSSDNDSAVGSLKCEPVFKEGDLVWGGFSHASYWPCIVIKNDTKNEDDKASTTCVRYFNYGGMKSVLPNKRVFPYCSLDDFWTEMKNRKISKSALNAIKNHLNWRAIEEIKFFTELDEQQRLKLFELVVKLSSNNYNLKRRFHVSITQEHLNHEDVTEDVKGPLEKYIQGMTLYDEIEKNKDLIKKETKRIKLEKQEESDASSSQSAHRQSERQSERAIIKRRFSYMSEFNTSKENSPDLESKPVVKKPKLEKVNIPLEERFKFNPKHITNLFKMPESEVCIECQIVFDDDQTYKCSQCALYFHKKCSHQLGEDQKGLIRHLTGDSELLIVTESTEFEIICKPCKKLKTICSLCKEPLSENKKENLACNLNDCKHTYHVKCLKQCHQSGLKHGNNKHPCPQHSCHTCFSKNINKTGTLVKCVKCPAAYHGDIFCLPAGSQVISKGKIICPRHPLAKEKTTIPVNLNDCSTCGQGGDLVCCDSCPKSYHTECLPAGSSELNDDDPFHCDDCCMGILPTFNTCVYAKVGAYRWWPAYILTPTEAKNLRNTGKPKLPRQFCIKFFGDYTYHWTTHERVLICTDDPSCKNLKVKNSLDNGFKTAIEEVNQMLSILDDQYVNNVKVIPKPYTKIQVNKIVPPAKMKKNKNLDSEICNCSPDEPSPCGIDSDCIVRRLHYECNKSCPAGDKCENQKMQKKEYKEMEIKHTKKRGFGAFAKEDIQQGEFVIEYVGDIIDPAEKERRLKLMHERNDKDYYFLTIDTDTIIDAGPCGNSARFINHSCKPNCTTFRCNVEGLVRVGIYALEDIKTGTELTFDYQFDYDASKPCYCQSENCTGVMGGNEKVEVKQEVKTKVSSSKVKNGNSTKKDRLKTKIKRVPKIKKLINVDPVVTNTPDPIEAMMEDV